MACLELSAGPQLPARDALDRTEHMFSRVGQQVQDLDVVLGRLKAAHLVLVVLVAHTPCVLRCGIRV